MRTSYICILFKFDTETLFDLGGFYCFSLFLLFSFLFPEISFAMPILPFATTRADEDLLAVAEVLAAAGGEKRISPPRAGRCWAPRDGRLQVLRELRPQCSCGLQLGMAMGPIPDPRRGFHPLGDVNGVFLVPVGILTDQILSPSGEPGTGTFLVSLVPVTHRGPRQQHQRSPPATETKPRPINTV